MFSIYSLLRFVVLAAVVVADCLLIRRSKKIKNKKRCTALSVIAICICVPFLLYPIPYEDLVTSFSSPEAAYSYCGTGTAAAVVDGKQSSMVVSWEGQQSISFRVFPKGKDGWKLGSTLRETRTSAEGTGPFSTEVYRYGDLKDYYIVMSDFTATNPVVNDSENTEFQVLENNVYDYRFVLGCVQNPTSDYQLTIQGETYFLNLAG